jgi:hypothetical protein
MEKVKGRSGFTHERTYEGKTNDWITPKWIIDAFGDRYFDLDPCASLTQPWPCASVSYTEEDDGFNASWFGNVWMNPPYGPHTIKWISKIAVHGEGIALIFARTDTRLFQRVIFPTASGYLFLSGRVMFCTSNGEVQQHASAPSVLISWGGANRVTLEKLLREGKLKGAMFGATLHD